MEWEGKEAAIEKEKKLSHGDGTIKQVGID